MDSTASWAWRILVICAAALVGGYAVARLRLVVFPVVGALFLSTLLVPPANWLRRRGLRPGLATAVVFVLGLALVGGIAAMIAPSVSRQLAQTGLIVRQGAEDVLTWLAQGPFDVAREDIDALIDQASERIRANANQIARGVLHGAATAVEFLAGALLALVLTFFFVKDGARFSGAILSLFPNAQHDHVREIGSRSWSTLVSYVRGIAVIATVDAIAIGAGLALIGVPLVLPLSLLVFVGAFMPVIGAFVAGTIAALVALVTIGLVKALIVVALVVAVQQFEGHVLTPVVLGRATQLHPVVVILALTAGVVVGGIAGAFVSVPIAAVLAAMLSYARSLGVPVDKVEEVVLASAAPEDEGESAPA